MLHRFQQPVAHMPLPRRLNNPFSCDPHPLCRAAAAEVQAYLAQHPEWEAELARGKMFGVLVVRDAEGELGFLAAFSGNLAGSNRHSYFVPPVYDMLQPGDLFRVGEAAISAINREIERLEADEQLIACRVQRSAWQVESESELAAAKMRMAAAKELRDLRRAQGMDDALLSEELQLESQHEKAEFRRLKALWAERLSAVQVAIERLEEPIIRLRSERKERSAALQSKLFERFELRNGCGRVENLHQIFALTSQGVPPAGAGECAAPKLFQCAFNQCFTPIALAEFWWGASPGGEMRRHGAYYPACRGKCGPILRYMLRGLEVEAEVDPASRTAMPILLWEDVSLAVVIKPPGMLSVPGLSDAPSVFDWFMRCYPHAEGPVVVHRLDMDTSGLLVLAKSKQVHKHLQAQFEARTIEKQYVALLDGSVAVPRGRITLPLRPDPYDRPRQVVDAVAGKESTTEYEVTAFAQGRTRILFRPLTGRTHQLRVHAAHVDGLNAPIVGDPLYGDRCCEGMESVVGTYCGESVFAEARCEGMKSATVSAEARCGMAGASADRLYLHARRLCFDHPTTGERLCFESEPDF